MQLQPNSSWGRYSLTLKLPTVNVSLTGLSASQHVSLSNDYHQFVAEPKSDEGGYTLECRALRLDESILRPVEEFDRDGQYALRIQRWKDNGGIDLTGYNFESHIRFNKTSASSTLGVFNEDHLPMGVVIENLFRIFVAQRALEQNGVELHSAGLVFDDQAYIFSGRSNAGKTTLTRKAYKGGARVLSDDINVLLPDERGYRAHAVPFTGEFGRTLDHTGGRDSYPVVAIVLLEQGDKLTAERVRPSQAVATLLTGCPFVNTDEYLSTRLFDVVTAVVAQVQVIRLVCRRDDHIHEIMDTVSKTLAIEYQD